MRHYSARQRQDGRWDYCCGSRPTGYCCSYRPVPEDGAYMPAPVARNWNEKLAPFAANFHEDGHATEEEACDCYKRYLLDTALVLQTVEPENATQQHRCEICKAWTACYARVGAYRLFVLCPRHQTREDVEKRLEIGESWES